jgi:lysyl-tRNA synthetase, class I
LDHKKNPADGKPYARIVLLGQEKGPRFGSFVAAYGIQNTVDMIDGELARSA